MPRWLSTAAGVVIIFSLIAGPVVYASRLQQQRRNFRVVRDGVLYRSGQMDLEGLRRVVHDYNLRTIISLRDGTTAAEQREEEFCRKAGIHFVRLPPLSWGTGEGKPAPVDDNVRAFRAVLDDPHNYPVLVHCFAGIHRTGAYVALYRMQYEGWSCDQALAEARDCEYTNIDEHRDVLGYLRHYQPVGKHH